MTESRLPELPEQIASLPRLTPKGSEQRLLEDGYLIEYRGAMGNHVEEIYTTVRRAATRGLSIHSEYQTQVWGSRQFAPTRAKPARDAKPVLSHDYKFTDPCLWRAPLFTTFGEHLDGLRIQLWRGDIYDTHYQQPAPQELQALNHRGPVKVPWFKPWADAMAGETR
jgi:hypothetical protein